MICLSCKINEAMEHGLVCTECMKKSQYQAKANILLDGANEYDWGLARLSTSILMPNAELKPEDTEICGTWGRMADGRLWLHLETPVQAIQDRATLMLAELAERRRLGLTLTAPAKKPAAPGGASVAKRTQTRSKPVTEAPQSVGSKIAEDMQALRDKLRPKA